jgi:ubiquinol-cytochrome c reductase cytochrome b subunit
VISRRIARWVDDRLGGARFARSALDKSFPDHFSFMLGEIALYCFVILVLTGTYLAFFFEPSLREVQYTGSYAPLRGVTMSAAYDSALHVSFDVRSGLVMRQMHHWAALIFVGSIVAHLCRIFFTGAFRRPREINWMVGVTLLLLAIVNGFAGYSLLDDLLSATGLRIAFSIAQSIPFIGNWLAFLAFGGEYPASSIISRLFIVHVFIVPAAIATLLAVHLAVLWHQKHTHFAGPGRREDNVVGSRLWPRYAAKSVSLFLAIFAVVALLGGLFQINPIWLYGPADPAAVTTASQPDWYMGWLEGALRIMPPWEIRAFGHEIPNPFFPGVLLPTLTFGLLYLWPFLEQWRTGDRREHHLLDRPRDRPARTALGVATLSFYIVLFLAGGSDVIADTFDVSVNAVLWAFRIGVFAAPIVTGLLTYRLCRDLSAARPPEPAEPVERPGAPEPADSPDHAEVVPA